jgi:GMP synthase-like glutamine amidotransferase
MRMRWLLGIALGLTLLFSYLGTSIAPSYADEGGDSIIAATCTQVAPGLYVCWP